MAFRCQTPDPRVERMNGQKVEKEEDGMDILFPRSKEDRYQRKKCHRIGAPASTTTIAPSFAYAASIQNISVSLARSLNPS